MQYLRKSRLQLVFAVVAAAMVVVLAGAVIAQNAAINGATIGQHKLSQEELETKIQATLTNATLAGRWCMIQDGQLGTNHEDKYVIQGITKVSADQWMIHAHVQAGQRDVMAPIPVQIKWAGDAPVLTVENLRLPGGGVGYTARVLFFENTYSGTWNSGSRSGLLHGVITHTTE